MRTRAMDLIGERGIERPVSAGVWRNGRVHFSGAIGDSRNLFELILSPHNWQAREVRRLTAGSSDESVPDGNPSRLVYSSLTTQRDLWVLMLGDSAEMSGEPERLTNDIADDRRPTLSLDGHHLVYASSRSGNSDVWYRSLPGGKDRAITVSPTHEVWPVISPNGDRVTYGVSDQIDGFLAGRISGVFGSPLDGGVPEPVCADCRRPEHWSHDGKYQLFLWGRGVSYIVGLLEVAGGKKVEVLQHPQHPLSSPRLSPDDRWIAFYEYTSPQSRRIWVAPFKGASVIPQADWIPITDGKMLDREPRWSPRGDLLYFNSTRDGFLCLWAQRIDRLTGRPSGYPFGAAHFHQARLSFQSPEHFATGGSRIVIVLTETRGNIWMYEDFSQSENDK